MKNLFLGFFFFLFIYGCQNKVDHSFLEKIKIGEAFQYPSKLVRNKKQFIHIFNQKNKPLYKLKPFIEFEKYDFSAHDYLLTFGKELIEIKAIQDNWRDWPNVGRLECYFDSM